MQRKTSPVRRKTSPVRRKTSPMQRKTSPCDEKRPPCDDHHRRPEKFRPREPTISHVAPGSLQTLTWDRNFWPLTSWCSVADGFITPIMRIIAPAKFVSARRSAFLNVPSQRTNYGSGGARPVRIAAQDTEKPRLAGSDEKDSPGCSVKIVRVKNCAP